MTTKDGPPVGGSGCRARAAVGRRFTVGRYHRLKVTRQAATSGSAGAGGPPGPSARPHDARRCGGREAAFAAVVRQAVPRDVPTQGGGSCRSTRGAPSVDRTTHDDGATILRPSRGSCRRGVGRIRAGGGQRPVRGASGPTIITCPTDRRVGPLPSRAASGELNP